MRSYIAACAVALAWSGAAVAADKIEWSKSFDEALKVAKENKKLVMVDVYAEWCGPCKMLDKQTFSHAKVVEFARSKLVALKVDGDTEDGKKVTEKFKVEGYPTILFLDGDGKEQDRLVGFLPAGPFLTKIDVFHKAFAEMPGLLAKLKENAGDVKTAVDVITVYAARGKLTDAEKVLAAATKAGAKEGDLAAAHNAIGDSHQEAGRFDQAIKHFKKASTGGTPKDKVYAISSVAACYTSMGKLKEALAEVENSLKVEGATDADKEEAKTLRDQLKEGIAAVEEKEKEAAASKANASKFIKWAKDVDDAVARAKTAKKFALVDFYAEWCGPCKMLEKEVYGDEKHAKALEEIVVSCKIDVDTDGGKPVAEKYGIQSLPTLLIFDEKGEVVGKLLSGYSSGSQEAFLKQVGDTVKVAKSFPANLAAWTKDNKNLEAGLGLAQAYLARGEMDKARPIVKALGELGGDLRKFGGQYFEIAQALVRENAPEGEAILKRLSTDGGSDDRAKALMMMAMSSVQKQDFQGALALVDKAAKIEGLGEATLKQIERMQKGLNSILDQMKKQKEAKKDD